MHKRVRTRMRAHTTTHDHNTEGHSEARSPAPARCDQALLSVAVALASVQPSAAGEHGRRAVGQARDLNPVQVPGCGRPVMMAAKPGKGSMAGCECPAEFSLKTMQRPMLLLVPR